MEQSDSQRMSTGKVVALAVLIGVFVSALLIGMLSLASKNISPNILGEATASSGVVGVYIVAGLGIAVDAQHNKIDFGAMTRGSSASTVPPLAAFLNSTSNATNATGFMPFHIRNMGTEKADVEVCASPLWNSTQRIPSDYQFSVTDSDPRIPTMDACTLTPCFNKANSQILPQSMPVTCPKGALAVNDLNWEDPKDEAIVHIYVRVPADETLTAKNSIVTFSAVAASTYPVPIPTGQT